MSFFPEALVFFCELRCLMTVHDAGAPGLHSCNLGECLTPVTTLPLMKRYLHFYRCVIVTFLEAVESGTRQPQFSNPVFF